VAAINQQTPIYDWHAGNGARLVDFAGWRMPVQYTSIVSEHQATRQSVGVFDVSHMARFRFQGSAARGFLDGLVTRRMADLRPGRLRYALVTRGDGGILDDVIVACLAGRDGEPLFWMVANAGNRDKIAAWIAGQPGDPAVAWRDETLTTAMIAVQGPRALVAVQPVAGDLASDPLPYYGGRVVDYKGRPVVVSRTGYTGEDGVELIVPAEAALDAWQVVLRAARSLGGGPAGLGARDTLRLEAGMPLYGHELSEQIDPFQAGLAFAVDLRGRTFPGSRALLAMRTRTDVPRRIGLVLQGRRVPRQHQPVLAGDRVVGEITSGTFSPTLGRPIAMAYVPADHDTAGTLLHIDIRGKLEPAVVAPLPFYQREPPGDARP
jgi:aminomethyltransferase